MLKHLKLYPLFICILSFNMVDMKSTEALQTARSSCNRQLPCEGHVH